METPIPVVYLVVGYVLRSCEKGLIGSKAIVRLSVELKRYCLVYDLFRYVKDLYY
jgi:hypothetical protein